MFFYNSFSVRPKCDWLIGTQKRPTSPIPPATATHTDATSMATSRSSFSSRVPSVPCRSLPYVAVSKLNVSRFPSLCCLLWLFLFKFSLAHYISFDSFFFFFSDEYFCRVCNAKEEVTRPQALHKRKPRLSPVDFSAPAVSSDIRGRLAPSIDRSDRSTDQPMKSAGLIHRLTN